MNRCFAVLYDRKTINDGIFAFRPSTIIEGDYEEISYDSEGNETNDVDSAIYFERFFSDGSNSYYLMDQLSQLEDANDDKVVGNVINEELLLDIYKDIDDDLDVAKVLYYSDISDNVYIGVADFEEHKMNILKFNSNDFRITSSLEDIENKIVGIAVLSRVGSKNNAGMLIDSYEEVEELPCLDLNKMFDNFSKDYNYLLDTNIEEINEYFKDCANSYMSINDKLFDSNLKLGYICRKCLMLSCENDIDKAKSEISRLSEYIVKNKKELIDKYNEIIENIEDEDNYFEENDDVSNKKEESKYNRRVDVRKLKEFLDLKIIGQESAKRDVIMAVCMNSIIDDPKNKISCLLVGPTGSGKTLIAESIGEYFDRPVEVIDTTQLSMPGYVGANIEDFLVDLYMRAGNDLDKAEHSIVVLDEIDKKGSSSNDDISGRGVLNTLLPFIQGTNYNIQIGKGYNNKTIVFNTSNLTIFATGAFTNVYEQTKSDYNEYSETKIGFNKDNDNNKKNVEDIQYKKFTRNDLEKYGDIPIELLGRFSTISQLHGHTVDSLKKIITESSISPLLSKKNKLKLFGIDLEYDDDYLDAVANKAIELKTGARSLLSTIEYSIKNAEWEVIYNIDKYKKIILKKESVNNNLDVLLEDKDNNIVNLKDIYSLDKPKVLIKK